MPNEAKNPSIRISPTETLTAVVDKGKLGYVYESLKKGSYVFEKGGMRMRAKPEFKTILLQGVIPAELFRTKPDEVMAFFKAHIELCKQA